MSCINNQSGLKIPHIQSGQSSVICTDMSSVYIVFFFLRFTRFFSDNDF